MNKDNKRKIYGFITLATALYLTACSTIDRPAKSNTEISEIPIEREMPDETKETADVEDIIEEMDSGALIEKRGSGHGEGLTFYFQFYDYDKDIDEKIKKTKINNISEAIDLAKEVDACLLQIYLPEGVYSEENMIEIPANMCVIINGSNSEKFEIIRESDSIGEVNPIFNLKEGSQLYLDDLKINMNGSEGPISNFPLAFSNYNAFIQLDSVSGLDDKVKMDIYGCSVKSENSSLGSIICTSPYTFISLDNSHALNIYVENTDLDGSQDFESEEEMPEVNIYNGSTINKIGAVGCSIRVGEAQIDNTKIINGIANFYGSTIKEVHASDSIVRIYGSKVTKQIEGINYSIYDVQLSDLSTLDKGEPVDVFIDFTSGIAFFDNSLPGGCLGIDRGNGMVQNVFPEGDLFMGIEENTQDQDQDKYQDQNDADRFPFYDDIPEFI